MILKCTAWTDLGNQYASIWVKDCDDNPIVLPKQMDELDILLPDGSMKRFTNLKIETKSADTIQNGFLTHPYICRYDTVE